MAFSRSFLKSSGLTDEQIAAVMEEHVTVTDALKKERDGYKETAEKLPQVQKELDEIKGGEDWKKKFEDEHKAFENFKTKTAQDAEAAEVRVAVKKLLSEEGYSDKWADRIMKGLDMSGMKRDKEGNLIDADKLKESVNKEWSEVKTTVTVKGADVEKPPHTGNGKMTKEEILKIEDTSERQKAIANNLELFGKG